MENHHGQAAEWLAAAATDPRACKREWHGESGIAVLAAGRFWDVLSVPEELGLLALDVLLRTPHLQAGPTLADFTAHRVGFFLPPDSNGRWVGSGIRYVGQGAWIAVPAPYRATGLQRWLIPPDGRGTLHVPATVELALQRATGILSALLGPASSPHPGKASAPTPAARTGRCLLRSLSTQDRAKRPE